MVKIHSGGALGADTLFGNMGTDLGYEVIHHSFKGHIIACDGLRVEHTDEELRVADYLLKKANIIMKRSYPTSKEFVNNLLRRNYYQIKDVNLVIAVAPLESKNNVKGGTGWATEMARLLSKTICVFDDKQTYRWYVSIAGKDFRKLKEGKYPPNNIDFAGIGSRDISPEAFNEIEKFLKRTK
jgi:hypothetical protein